MTYVFYEHGKYIGEFELASEEDAKEKANELEMTFMTLELKSNPIVTYAEVKHEDYKERTACKSTCNAD